MSNLADYEKDIQELETLLGNCTRTRSKNLLITEISTLTKLIETVNIKMNFLEYLGEEKCSSANPSY